MRSRTSSDSSSLVLAQVGLQQLAVAARASRACRGWRAAGAARARPSSPSSACSSTIELGVDGSGRRSRSPRRRPARTGGSGRPAGARGGRTRRGTRASPAAAACACRARGRRGRPARCPRGAASASAAASSKVNISFCTMSVDSPTPRANSSVVLERRRLDPPVARGLEDAPRGRLDRRRAARVGGQHVERAARGLELRCSPARARARNGLVARSRPSVVSPCGPGRRACSSG